MRHFGNSGERFTCPVSWQTAVKSGKHPDKCGIVREVVDGLAQAGWASDPTENGAVPFKTAPSTCRFVTGADSRIAHRQIRERGRPSHAAVDLQTPSVPAPGHRHLPASKGFTA
jgi:hypothetical protein